MSANSFAEENFYCPSEIYCSVDPVIKRVRCKTDEIEQNIWLDAEGATTGTIRLAYVTFKGYANMANHERACVYIKDGYGTVIDPKIEYNLVPDMKETSKWINAHQNGRVSTRYMNEDFQCGSLLTKSSRVSSSKDCPFKIDSSLLLVSNSAIYPVWLGSKSMGAEAYYIQRIPYPDNTHISNAYKIEYGYAKLICGNEKICKIDLSFKFNEKTYDDGSIWVDMDNNMKIFDISQPKNSSFKIVKIGFNSVEIKNIN